MAFSRNIVLRAIHVQCDDTGAPAKILRVRAMQYTDSSDGSVDTGPERADELTLAQLKTLVAGL